MDTDRRSRKSEIRRSKDWDDLAPNVKQGELASRVNTHYNFSVSTKAQNVLDEFRRLAPTEQRLVWNEIAQTFAPTDYGTLSDEDLTAVADRTFVLLDKEERDAQQG